MLLKSYIQRNRPVSIVHFITNRCNARCKHCFIDFDDENVFKGDFTLGEIKKFISNLSGSLKNVNLTGGEPLLRNDFYEIVQEYFNKTNIDSVFVTTNGFFTDKTLKVANDFIQDKRYDGKKIVFSVSLDNFPEKHDENRRIKGLFERAINTYNKLTELNNPKIIVNVNLCVTPENCDDIDNIFRYMTEERGVKAVTSIMLRGKKIDPETRKKIYEGYVKLCRLIDGGLANHKLEGYGDSLFGKILNAKNVILHREVARTFLTNEYLTPCYAGGLFGVVCANGDVYPCEMLSLKMGNLRDFDYDLNEVFDSNAAKTARKYIKETNCHCTYECAWTINIFMNPKYVADIIKSTMALNNPKLFHGLNNEINVDVSNLNVGLNTDKDDVSMYKSVPGSYMQLMSSHPVIKVDPMDTTHSVSDKKVKIEKLKVFS